MGLLANIVQLVGAAVTFLGLAHAYTRSRYDLSLWQWIRSKFARPLPPERHSGHAVGLHVPVSLSMRGYAPFVLDTNLPTDAQVAELARYVRELRGLFTPIEQRLDQVDRDIAAAREHAEFVATQALTDARQHLDRFKSEQTRAEVLDLRIALYGLAISVVGTILAFWS